MRIHQSLTTKSLSVLGILALLLACDGEVRNPVQSSTGPLDITTSTSGIPSTGNGYGYVLDANPAEPIAFNTTIHLLDLFAGSHTVQLSFLPAGCSLASQNPVTVDVSTGVPTAVAFQVTCVPSTSDTIPAPADTVTRLIGQLP
jgi:hypothetical protein